MKDIIVPANLRILFKKPFGDLITGKGLEAAEKAKERLSGRKLIVVGDETLKNMKAIGVSPDLAIIDQKVKRKSVDTELEGEAIKALNPPGWISADLQGKIYSALEEAKPLILVEGEEDLAVLPCILDADWDTVILYGQPNEGLVFVEVNEETKVKAGMIYKTLTSVSEEA